MSAKTIILAGAKFTKLTTVKEVSLDMWLCVCGCGKEKLVSHKGLTRGDTKSCGCLIKENSHRTHGFAADAENGKRPAIYRVWKSMKERCNLKTSKNYKDYGGKGIQVCERWNDFHNFLSDMGSVPDGMSIDRIDSSGNYEPGNCRWANQTTQARNRSITKNVEYLGTVRPLSEWAEITGINYNCLRRRIDIGWSVERAMTTPVLSIQEVSALGGRTRRAQLNHIPVKD